jgi:hypothetical protein
MPQPREREPRKPDWQTLLARYDQTVQRYLTHPDGHALRQLRTGQDILIRELEKPGKFDLGRVVATPGAVQAMEDALHIPPEFLLRHKHGDWGELDEEDRQENEQSLSHGWRLVSAYDTRLQERLWVITEADRSATTLLLPNEY